MKVYYDASRLASFAAAWVARRKHPEADLVPTPPAALLDGDLDLTNADPLRVWESLYPERQAPWLVRFVADRQDHKLDYSQEVCAAVDSYPQTFAAWDALAELDPVAHSYGVRKGLIDEGRVVLRFKAVQAPVAASPTHEAEA